MSEEEHGQRRPRDYHDLLMWQKGMALAKQIYTLTQPFPDTEKFGLMTQMRRAAVSVPSNIAEGQAHYTTGEFIQFLSHAAGSVSELDTYTEHRPWILFRCKGAKGPVPYFGIEEDDHGPASKTFEQLLSPSDRK